MRKIPNANFGHPGQIDCHILGMCSGCEFPDGNALELTLAIFLGLLAAGTSGGGKSACWLLGADAIAGGGGGCAAADCWLLAAGCSVLVLVLAFVVLLLAAGCWLLAAAACCLLLPAGCCWLLLVVGC